MVNTDKKERQDWVVWPAGNPSDASVIHDTDHGRPDSHPNPHAHDHNGSHGEQRELNDVEREIYEYKNED